MARDDRPTVYSTDPKFTRPCKRCGRYPCRCPKPVSLPPERQTAAIRLERKGRGGKTVTVVMDLQLNSKDIKALAKTLKRACGSGGTAKEGVIEIQGDHRQKVADKLRSLGYNTKFAGG